MPRQNGASASLMTLDKRSKIMLVVLAVIVVIAAAYFLVFKKSSSSTANSAPTVTPSHSTAVTPKATPTPKATAKPAQAVLADSTRDPFQPLPEELAAAGSSSASSSPSSSPSSAAPSSSPSSSAPATGSHTVMVLSITGTSASLTYNGTTKTVKAGDSLATGVSVIKIDADSVFVGYNNKLYAAAPGQTVNF